MCYRVKYEIRVRDIQTTDFDVSIIHIHVSICGENRQIATSCSVSYEDPVREIQTIKIVVCIFKNRQTERQKCTALLRLEMEFVMFRRLILCYMCVCIHKRCHKKDWTTAMCCFVTYEDKVGDIQTKSQ